MPTSMTKAERAAYMRDYRARKKSSDGAGAVQSAEQLPVPPPGSVAPPIEGGTARQKRSGNIPALDGQSGTGTYANPLAVPSFLAAPDDDCLACGHDQQAYHLAGRCTFPISRRQPCGCPAFVAAF